MACFRSATMTTTMPASASWRGYAKSRGWCMFTSVVRLTDVGMTLASRVVLVQPNGSTPTPAMSRALCIELARSQGDFLDAIQEMKHGSQTFPA